MSTGTSHPRQWRSISGPLHAERLDVDADPSQSPLILLHGFTQTCQSWDPLLDALETIEAARRPIVRVDLPGHGGSHAVCADLSSTADLVVETCGAGIYCGYSMGGRVALHIAVQHAPDVEALITVGATAGIVDDDERRRRREADDDLADTIERIGTEAFIDQWLAQPMFAGLERSEIDRAQRTSNPPAGLAMSLRTCGTGTQTPLWSRLADLEMPILLLAGAQDSKFSDIADRMAEAIGVNARSVRIAHAGHSAHVENPQGVAREIISFLETW